MPSVEEELAQRLARGEEVVLATVIKLDGKPPSRAGAKLLMTRTATLAGTVSANATGPMRQRYGGVRDQLIGIGLARADGQCARAGGKVVKNVAGYDFCKLLTGSLGTLGVIAQITLKVKPLPERSVLLACDVATFAQAEVLLAALVRPTCGSSLTVCFAVSVCTPAGRKNVIVQGP